MKTYKNAVANKLIDARKLLQKDGWTQHVYKRSSGEHCLIGALGDTCHSVSVNRGTQTAIRFLLGEIYALHSKGLAEWNDRPKRKQEDVIKLLNEAASLVLSNDEI